MADRDRPGEDGRQGFLKRWSRLKQEEAGKQPAAPTITADVATAGVTTAEVPVKVPEGSARAEVETASAPEADLPEAGAEAPEAETEAPFDPADLPDIDSLDKDSDFTVFLQEGVPKKLRHMALQKLWRSDPALAVLDGLNDYDEDFTIVEKIVETIGSNYKTGRGYADVEDEVEEIEDDEASDIEASDIDDDELEDAEAGETRLADAEEKKPAKKKGRNS